MNRKVNLLKEYKILRNTSTKTKRDNNFKYYQEYFELHKDKSSSIWKSPKKDISIVDDKGVIISDQVKICNQFNNFFVNIIGQDIELR